MRINQNSKKPTNLSLDKSLLVEARDLGVNLSQAAEVGLRDAVIKTKSELWKIENADALTSSNEWTDANELPLEKYRQF